MIFTAAFIRGWWWSAAGALAGRNCQQGSERRLTSMMNASGLSSNVAIRLCRSFLGLSSLGTACVEMWKACISLQAVWMACKSMLLQLECIAVLTPRIRIIYMPLDCSQLRVGDRDRERERERDRERDREREGEK
jgi:hypothetical protein